MEYCYGCFGTKSVGVAICSHCGFSLENYEKRNWILAPGTVLNDKYLVGKTLGEGGFGITYLALDTVLETRVAIKEYYPGNIVSRDVTSNNGNSLASTFGARADDFQEGLKRYVKEAAMLAKFFSLPGIVTVKDFFYENGTAYIAMEYIDGISMKSFLAERGGKLSVDETLRLIQPVISSLAVIHNNKLLHRDISPDNIMLENNGGVKLIDFGAARYFSGENNMSMTVVLKHGYAPIEQYSRKGEQGVWTDVYALCAVLYRMITGVVPEEAVERVSEDNLKPIRKIVRKVPKHIAAAIEKGLSVMPEDRQQSMEELYNELYVTKKELSARRTDKIYRALRKLLILIIIILTGILSVGIMVKKNTKKIDDIKSKVVAIFDEEEVEEIKQTEKAEAESEQSELRSDSNVIKEPETNIVSDTEVIEEDKKQEIKTEEIYSEADVKKEEQTVETIIETEIHKETQQDERVSHGIIVARDGILDGYGDSLTVGNILDTFSEIKGTWNGYVDESGQIYIYYLGSKNGESFAIEFQIYSNDTFKITGAARNGEPIDSYSEYFQNILNEVGV